MSQKPSIGRIVHYVLAERDSTTSFGRTRPAIIVDLVEDGSKDGLVNLQVFTNGGIDQLPPVQHCKNIVHDESAKQGTWHWPPFVAPAKEKIDLSKMSVEKMEMETSNLKAQLEARRPTPKNFEEQQKMEAEAATEPFPTTPDTGSMAAAFASGDIPPPRDPVAASRPTEPFPPEDDESDAP